MSPDDFERLFARVPPLAGMAPADFTISPLPGYTNRNFRLHNRHHDWVLRIPRPETDRFIDRDAEAGNQAQACALGLAPRPFWRGNSGLTLTPTLSARTASASDFGAADKLSAIAVSVKRLHRDAGEFSGRVELEPLLLRYHALLSRGQQANFESRMNAGRRLIQPLEDRDIAYVASHNDLVLENLLFEGERPWLIDWEFSAMASPYWDLATLCNAANLGYEGSLHLLAAYCADGESMEETLLFDYRILLRLLADCWMAALSND